MVGFYCGKKHFTFISLGHSLCAIGEKGTRCVTGVSRLIGRGNVVSAVVFSSSSVLVNFGAGNLFQLVTGRNCEDRGVSVGYNIFSL